MVLIVRGVGCLHRKSRECNGTGPAARAAADNRKPPCVRVGIVLIVRWDRRTFQQASGDKQLRDERIIRAKRWKEYAGAYMQGRHAVEIGRRSGRQQG